MPTFPVVFVDLGTTPDLDLRRIHERDNASGCGLWPLKCSRRPCFAERLLAESTWVGAVIENDEAGRAARPLWRYTLSFLEPRTDPRAFAAKLGERLGRKAEPMARNLLESLVEEGRKEGRVEGRVETLRRVIERVIENRFGAASAAAIASVRKANDSESLDSLFEAATRAGSLAEFEEHLRSLDRYG